MSVFETAITKKLFERQIAEKRRRKDIWKEK